MKFLIKSLFFTSMICFVLKGIGLINLTWLQCAIPGLISLVFIGLASFIVLSLLGFILKEKNKQVK